MIASEAEARAYCAEKLDAVQLEQVERLIAALSEENKNQNLVSRGTLLSVWQRHIADSLQIIDFASEAIPGPWLDLGSGAGFPGLVLAIALPNTTIRLVESRKRRVDWLERMVDQLELKNARVDGVRLEQLDAFPASVITARAFAPLPRLIELSARFSTKQTLWVLPKGRSAQHEVNQMKNSRKFVFHVKHSLTDPDAGIVVVQHRSIAMGGSSA